MTASTTDADDSESEHESDSTDERVIGYTIEYLEDDEREHADDEDRTPEWEEAMPSVYNYERNAAKRAGELEAKREGRAYRATEVTE